MSQALNAIYAKLSAASAVTDLVGANIEPELADQGDKYPCVLLSTDSDEAGMTHSGGDGISTAVIQMDCEGTTYTSASAVAAAVKAALNFQRGTWGSVIVQGCFIEDTTENYEYIDNENKFFGATVKATVVYQV